VTTYRGTVPDRPMVAVVMRYTEATVTRPARAGDVVEVPCPSGFCDGGEERGYGFPCDTCRGRGTVNVRLTEDPAPLHKQSKIERVDGAWMGEFDANDPETLVGWLIVGTIEP